MFPYRCSILIEERASQFGLHGQREDLLLDTIVQIPRETRSLLQARILLGQDLFARLVLGKLLGHLVKMGFELSDLISCRRGEVLVVLTFGKTSRRRANAPQPSDESPRRD